jgi:hypothetical protein
VLVDQQAQQLGHRQRRVGVVEVDRRLLAERVEPTVLGDVSGDQILQRRADEEC